MKSIHLLTVLSITVCFVLYTLEQWIGVPYIVKTAVKLFLFIGLPLLFYKLVTPPQQNKKKEQWKLPLFFSFVAFASLLIGYWVLGEAVDFLSIRTYLEQQLGITKPLFYLVGIYIIFGNSWVEEWFFRGFIFQQLWLNGKRGLGYLFSSSLFALYHLASIQGWFSIPLTILSVIGLFFIGLVFCFLTERAGSYKGSWIVHITADVAIILIALHAFNWL